MQNYRVGRATMTPLADDVGPTDAPAGSEEKIRVMTARASCGLPLFDPRDNRVFARAPRVTSAGRDPSVLPGCRWDSRRRRWRVDTTLLAGRKYVGLFVLLADAHLALALATAGNLAGAKAVGRCGLRE